MLTLLADDHQRHDGGYQSHYGLAEPPFGLTPDPRFLFESRSYSDALERLTSAIHHGEPLAAVTGEPGSGKTLLCRALLQRIEPRTFVSVIGNPLLGVDDLLRQILSDFGVVSRDHSRIRMAGTDELVVALRRFLVSLLPLRAGAVVMIDEAHLLQRDVLVLLRMLSGPGTAEHGRLQVLLVGQPELEDVLSQPGNGQWQHEASVPYRLLPLEASEVQPYIEHRLEVAERGGGTGRLNGPNGAGSSEGVGVEPQSRVRFTSRAVRLVGLLSRRVPRAINQLCEAALEVGYRRGKRAVGAVTVAIAARELGMRVPVDPRTRALAYAGLAVAIALTAAGVWLVSQTTLVSSSQSTTSLEAPARASAGTTAEAAETTPSELKTPLPQEALAAPTETAGSPNARQAPAMEGSTPTTGAPSPGSDAAPPGSNRQDRAILQRAQELARRPDVRGLERLRMEFLKEPGRVDDPRRDPVLAALDRHLDEARRLQLAVDAQDLRLIQGEEYRDALRLLVPDLDEASSALAAWSIGTGSRPDSKTTAALTSRLRALEPPSDLAAVHQRLTSSLDSLAKALANLNSDEAAGQVPQALAVIAEARGAFQRYLRTPDAAAQPRR